MVEFMTMSVIRAPITSPSNGSFALLIMWKQQQVSFAVMIIESLIYFVHCSIYFRPNNLGLPRPGYHRWWKLARRKTLVFSLWSMYNYPTRPTRMVLDKIKLTIFKNSRHKHGLHYCRDKMGQYWVLLCYWLDWIAKS